MEDGTTFVCEASNMYGRDQYHVSVELGGIRESLSCSVSNEWHILLIPNEYPVPIQIY